MYSYLSAAWLGAEGRDVFWWAHQGCTLCISSYINVRQSLSVGHAHAHKTETKEAPVQTGIFPILEHSLIFESGSGSDPVLSSTVFYKQINEKGP